MDIEKLMMAKASMDKTRQMDSGQVAKPKQSLQVENFDMPQAKYNIPSEMMESVPQMPISSLPKSNPGVGFNKPSVDAIKKSKLPDEIKRLMIEHPIQQPNNMGGGSVLSNELVEKAARLMNNDVANNVNPLQSKKITQENKSQNVTSNLDKNLLKDLIKETIEEVLGENGLLIESTSKTNDMFQFRVGSHIFEGKVTRIKKVK